ncbi:hypothetical protein niasHT_008723 [Heterodera trifolii]|uniref:Regulatory protein zeste n=1 Tax=Heterodera trifolii TaxID=157864 RepID=A0ABD2M2A9_9BILA
MKGRTNMPLEAVLALVHMVKARQQELRNHTKLDGVSGWTVRNQTWHEITTELNIRYGRELTVDQCMKKLLNIKSMTRYKLEDQERKRSRPGMEHFVVKLTPAEREYIRLFYHGAPANPPVPGSDSWEHIQMLLGGDFQMPSFEGGQNAGDALLKDEFLAGEDEVFEIGDDEAEDNLPDERPSFSESTLAQAPSAALRGPWHSRKVEAGDSLTNAILGILPQQSADDAEAGSSGNGPMHSAEHHQHETDQQQQMISSGTGAASVEGNAIAAGVRRHSLLGPIPIRSQQQQSVEGQQSTIGQPMVRNLPPATVRTANFAQNYSQSLVNSQHPTVANNCHSEQHFAGRKRRAFPPPPQSSALPLNGFSNCVGEDGETVELRLKRLKCELIEKQLMELGHQEEWRLKQEFLLGRQTAAMENIVIQLRQIKEKLK